MEPCSESRCPACRRNPVADPREPCGECLAAFGPMIQRSGREISAEDFTADLERGEQDVARVLAERRQMTAATAATTDQPKESA
jgi:hypothetical protein